MFCQKCGKEIAGEGKICSFCGTVNYADANAPQSGKKISEKWVACTLLVVFLGIMGGHRFFTGKIATGVIMLLTFGGFFIWNIIDIAVVISGNFRDKKGNLIQQYE